MTSSTAQGMYSGLSIPKPTAPTERLPFFVYGTLRHGQGNWNWALKDRTQHETPATLDKAIMYSQGGFPYVTRTDSPTEIVTGELITVYPDEFEATLSDLDTLEGYTPDSQFNLYDRVIVTVHVNNLRPAARAWTYVVGSTGKKDLERLPRVLSGDWVDYVNTGSTYTTR